MTRYDVPLSRRGYLQVAEDVFYYPDVMVVAPPESEETGDEALFEDTPCLVVEVTSPSAEAIDRREKLSSLRACLIVEGHEMRDQWWQVEISVPEGVVPLPCSETELTLQQIYEGL